MTNSSSNSQLSSFSPQPSGTPTPVEPPSSDKEHLRVTVYSPESGLKHPLSLLSSMWRSVISPNCRDLAWRLMVRNISAFYRQSIGGVLWMFVTPLFSAAVWIFLNSQKIINIKGAGMPYPVFVLVGNLIWLSFINSIDMPMKSVSREKTLLTKLSFPREALLLAGFGELLINSFVPMLVLVPVFMYFKIVPTLGMLAAPLVIMAFILFGYAIGMVILPVNLLFGDVARVLQMVKRIAFYLTPVIYPIPASGALHVIARWNPTVPFVVTARELLTGLSLTLLNPMLMIFGVVLIGVFFGLLLFHLVMPIIIERMSA